MKKEDKNKINIDEELEKIKQEQGIEITKEDEENLRKVLEFVVKKNPSSLKNKIFNLFKSIILNLFLYIVSYFALYGILSTQITFDSKLVLPLFILILSIYQVLVKKVVFINAKTVNKGSLKYIAFLIISFILLYFILDMINVINFVNIVMLILYYFGAELIVFMCKYYIAKHTINKLFR